MVFVGFNQKVKKSDSKTKVSHIFGFRIKSHFQNLAFLGFLVFSYVFAHFASNTLVFLVFSLLFNGLEQKLKKSDGKTKVSHISEIRLRFHPSSARLGFHPALEPTYWIWTNDFQVMCSSFGGCDNYIKYTSKSKGTHSTTRYTVHIYIYIYIYIYIQCAARISRHRAISQFALISLFAWLQESGFLSAKWSKFRSFLRPGRSFLRPGR